MEMNGKKENQEKASPKGWNRETYLRKDHNPIVTWLVLVGRGVDPQGNRDNDRQQNSNQRERARDGESLNDEVSNGHAIVDRASHVTPEQFPDPTEVLNSQRPIQSQLFPKSCDRFRSRLKPQDNLSRIARNNPHDHEDDDRHQQ